MYKKIAIFSLLKNPKNTITMKKTTKIIATKEVKSLKEVKGTKKADASGTDLAKAKNRRVTFQLIQ